MNDQPQWVIDCDGDLICDSQGYDIERYRFGEERGRLYDWPVHMAEKGWVNFDQFEAAFREASLGMLDQRHLDLSFARARRQRVNDFGDVK